MKIYKTHFLVAIYIISLGLLAFAGYTIGNLKSEAAIKKQQGQINPNFITDVSVIDLPRMNLTLSSAAGGSGRIRIDMSLEVERKDMERVADFEPVIMDKLVRHMRQLRIEDVKGPNAAPLLRKEIKDEVYEIVRPTPIMDVVFRQFVIM